ncbi:MAG: septum formation initiator family protein [Thermodesulfobacteriota bacterium]
MASTGGRAGFLFFLAGLIVVFGLMLLYGDNGLLQLRTMRQEIEKLEVENAELKEQNRRLLRHIERIKSDPRYIEDEIRKKLGFIRPDETIYRLGEESESNKPADDKN